MLAYKVTARPPPGHIFLDGAASLMGPLDVLLDMPLVILVAALEDELEAELDAAHALPAKAAGTR